MAAKLKKGDQVIVIAGSQKGKTGEIVKMFPKQDRVIIGGLNKVKRHQRPSGMDAGGIQEKEAPIHISNVAYLDPKENKATRIGFKVLKDGRKARVATRSGETISE
jgi:large subunit ribosomal protein L24